MTNNRLYCKDFLLNVNLDINKFASECAFVKEVGNIKL